VWCGSLTAGVVVMRDVLHGRSGFGRDARWERMRAAGTGTSVKGLLWMTGDERWDWTPFLGWRIEEGGTAM